MQLCGSTAPEDPLELHIDRREHGHHVLLKEHVGKNRRLSYDASIILQMRKVTKPVGLSRRQQFHINFDTPT